MKRSVALIIETSSVYGRSVLRGVMRHMRLRDDWSVFLEQRDLIREPPVWLENWQGDGIISRSTTPQLLSAIQQTGVPLVELTDRLGQSAWPQVRSDDEAIGRLAAEHLIERGFHRFAFCGFSGEAWSDRRRDAFVRRTAESSTEPCRVYESYWVGAHALPWDEEQRRISAWLGEIEPPLAVMACNDVRGLHLIEACRSLGLAVPEEVAIIGVDNDELLCGIASPPMTSVVPNAEAVGYYAAETLATLMGGDPPAASTRLIAPLGVEIRQSTDVVAIDDRRVAAALHYIRQNACQGISVDEIVQHADLSRSTLERQLRRYLGRTPQQEIRHVQVRRASELLRTTDLSVERIAAACGFDHPEYLHVVFKRITGETVGAYRRRVRPS